MTQAQSAANPPVAVLLDELLNGPPGQFGYVLNANDAGLLKSLDKVTAEQASAPLPGSRATMAAHVAHLCYSLEMANRWRPGQNPYEGADWSAAWKRTKVTAEEWDDLRAKLRNEAMQWVAVVRRLQPADDKTAAGVLGSVVHLAYHFGALRQMNPALHGPREGGTGG